MDHNLDARCKECNSAMVQSKGLCRKCYQRKYMKEKGNEDQRKRRKNKKRTKPNAHRTIGQKTEASGADPIKALENEIARYEELYAITVGLEGRMRWRRRINLAKQRIEELKRA